MEYIIIILAILTFLSVLCLETLFMRKNENNNRKEEIINQTEYEYTSNLINLINSTIKQEVEKKLRNYITFGGQYNIKNIDKDIGDVSIIIRSSIKPEMLNNKKNMYTIDYIYTYIFDTVSNIFIEYSKPYS